MKSNDVIFYKIYIDRYQDTILRHSIIRGGLARQITNTEAM